MASPQGVHQTGHHLPQGPLRRLPPARPAHTIRLDVVAKAGLRTGGVFLSRLSKVLIPAVLHAGLPASAEREKRSIFCWGQAPAQGMVPARSWARMASACWLTSS